ncbi:histidine kinase [Paraburkholderia sp. IMGN_8]|uniref:histidine kinase n=1 Tax=Paraburkholderia sp. IMGN_8 TaxID=3136564 RepID=UPI003100C7A3
MHGTYNFWLVSLSLIIATLSAYTVLDLAGFISVLEKPKLKHAWLGGGAAAMGTGIWTMHFVGMLAFSLPIPLGYDSRLTGTSLAIAVLISYFALNVVTRAKLTRIHLTMGGVLMGLGIAGMHYTGMAAAHFLPGAICGAANGINAQWLATTITLFTLAILTVTLMVSRFDARTTFLRGMADTLEDLVRKRTGELEGALRQYERTTHMLQLTRQKMEREIEERKEAQARLEQEKDEQRRLIHELEDTHVQLLQSEKLASIGQLAAGVAHEINNPMGFVNANLNTLRSWVQRLIQVVSAHESLVGRLDPDARAPFVAAWKEADIDYVRDDNLTLVDESIDGAVRVRRIVQGLRDFSRPGSDEWSIVDVHAGLESTLNVVHNEIKYKAQVVREYGPLPDVECLPPQLNQVFMNLLLNAAQAIPERGVITIRTKSDDETVSIAISDTGVGMSADVASRIFDPFFTTKPVGQGTGLGLSVSHRIVERHRGCIDVASQPGRGTTFTVRFPIRRNLRGADTYASRRSA